MAVRREAWPLHLRLTAGRPSWAGVARIGRRVTAEDHESATLFGLALVGYLVLALLLVYVSQAIVGDAWSRVGNAYYMLFSRDPHLAAIGFVWNPLPSLAVLPLLPFSLIWPDLVGAGLAGNIVSALFMAAATVEVAGTLRDFGVRRLVRLILVGAFALHPLVVYYGANGMSEAPFLFFLVLIVRYLARWLEHRATRSLVIAALGLAGAYLTRYEAAAAAAGAIAIVAAASAMAAPAGQRRISSLAEAVVFGLPFAAAFGLWSLASWIIVGSPFETFTSIYGNSSQVSLSTQQIQSSTGRGVVEASEYAIAQIQGLEPLLLLVIAAVVLIAAVRRDPRFVPIVVVLGSVAAFSLAAFATGRSFGWLRFYIVVIPMCVLAAGYVAARWNEPSDGRARGPAPVRAAARIPPRLLRSIAALAAIAAVSATVLALPTGWTTIRDDRLAREEAHQLRGLIQDSRYPGTAPPERAQYLVGGQVATYLDGLDLPDGSVVVDVAIGFPIVLQSRDPHQFVITTDRDFKAVVQDPVVYKAEYLLVAPPSGLGSLDAINRQYPSLYVTGVGLPVTLDREFDAPGFDGIRWRLYRLTPPS